MIDALFVYHYLAHYREPVFQELVKGGDGESEEIRFFVAASSHSYIKSIKTINPIADERLKWRWFELKNVWIGSSFLWQKGLLRLLRGGGYSAVIFLGDVHFISTWLAAALCRARGIKVYMWTHGILKDEGSLKWVIRKMFYLMADGLFLYGNRAKSLLQEKGFKPERLHVIYNSLNHFKHTVIFESSILCRESLRRRIGFNRHEKLIVYSGRITADKGIDRVIHLFRNIIEIDNLYRLVIVGDGPALNVVKKLAYDLGIGGNIKFVGESYDEEYVGHILMAADVVFFPGNIGLTAIHALSFGTPVVTHNKFDSHKPEHEAIREGINGSFVSVDSVEEVFSKFEFWVNRKRTDPIGLADACRKPVEMFYNPLYQKQVFVKVIKEDCKCFMPRS
jgi:glycosyltransferase involved in cell wall biosynthesis